MANIQFQLRRGLSSLWTSVDPILSSGEMGVETDTNKIKIGNGLSGWTSLAYVAGEAGVSGGSGVTLGGTNVFTALNSFSAGISASGITMPDGSSINGAITFSDPLIVAGDMIIGHGVGAGANPITTNIAIGSNSLVFAKSTVFEDNNIALGQDSLNSLGTGSSNIAIGPSVLGVIKTGYYNIGIGTKALNNLGGPIFGNSAGNSNIAIGYQAGLVTSTGAFNRQLNNSILIGTNTKPLASDDTNIIVIGNGSTGLGSNSTVIGTNGTTFARIYGLLDLPSGISASNIYLRGITRTNSLVDYYVSVKDYGALGTGLTNDGPALQNALNSGFKNIYFPSGTYKVRQTLTIPKDVSVFGDGPNLSIIDGALGNCWGYQLPIMQTDTSGVTWTQLPSLVSGICSGNRYLNFSSSHGLTYDDMIWITANTPWSRWLTDYPDNKGEFCRIGIIDGTTGAAIQGSFYENYSLAGMCLYKVSNFSNSSIKNIGIMGQGISGSYDEGLNVRWVKDSFIENVKVTRCSASAINLFSCFNFNVNECFADDSGDAQYGLDYGLIVSNCQNLFVNGGMYSASRHAITHGTIPTYLTGTGSNFPSLGIVTRNTKFNGTMAFRSSVIEEAGACAVDTHSGTEYVQFTNMFVDGGFQLGGDRHTIDGCTIKGKAAGLIFCGSLKGTNLTFINNNLTTNYIYDQNTIGVFVNIGGQFTAIGATTQNGGIINIKNNHFQYDNQKETRTRGDSDRRLWLTIANAGYTGEDIDINIEGNVIESCKNYPQGVGYIFGQSIAGGLTQSLFNTINFSNNVCSNVGGINIYGGGSGLGKIIANNVICEGNKIYNSYGGPALYARPIRNSILCKNNSINGTQAADAINNLGTTVDEPVSFGGWGSDLNGWSGYTDFIQVSDNTILNGVQTTSGGKKSDISIYYIKKSVVYGNVYGSDTNSLNVSTNAGFLLNEKITGSSSGSISTINGFYGNTTMGFSVPTSGSGFTQNEMITGFLSGKTATIAGITANHQSATLSVFSTTGTTSYFGRNVSISDKGLTFSDGSGSGMVVIPI